MNGYNFDRFPELVETMRTRIGSTNNSKTRTSIERAKRLFVSILIACSVAPMIAPPVLAIETWEKLDRRLKQQVFQLNIGLKMRMKDGPWIYWSDLSPKYRYPVYSTSVEDKGFRVVSFGSAFPVRTAQHDKTFFLTNRHVVEGGDNLFKECQRFFAAMRLYAEQTAEGNADARFKQLLQTANLSTKKDMSPSERSLYQLTVDTIWDTYEKFLSLRPDPARVMFNKYAKMNALECETGYFLHAPGPVTQQPLVAKLYKAAHGENEPDLAILGVTDAHVTGMDFETIPASEGQEVQVVGYPVASDQLDAQSSQYYAPTFNTGRVSRVGPHILQVDAPITTGNSGGPVVSLRGKVLGVVANRALSARGGELPNFGGAVSLQSIRQFAPELFGNL